MDRCTECGYESEGLRCLACRMGVWTHDGDDGLVIMGRDGWETFLAVATPAQRRDVLSQAVAFVGR